jgi:hypothetical protein
VTYQIEPLAWDSEFFAFPIGRVDLDDVEPESFAGLDAAARAQGLLCLYGSLDPGRLSTSVAAQQAGHRLVEVAMMLEHRRPPGYRPRATTSTVRVGRLDDIGALAPDIARIAPWSRYAVDPRFGFEAACRLQTAWMERAARGVDGRKLIVAEDDTGITGVCSQAPPDPEPWIDLIVTTKPGSGAAQLLLDHFHTEFGDVASRGGPVAARNVVSLRMLEHVGYRVTSVRYLYHRWLDEEPTAATEAR